MGPGGKGWAAGGEGGRKWLIIFTCCVNYMHTKYSDTDQHICVSFPILQGWLTKSPGARNVVRLHDDKNSHTWGSAWNVSGTASCLVCMSPNEMLQKTPHSRAWHRSLCEQWKTESWFKAAQRAAPESPWHLALPCSALLPYWLNPKRIKK